MSKNKNIKSSFIEKLKARWGVSASRVFIILLVFAMTGFTIMFLKEPVLSLFLEDGEKSVLFSVLYYLLILPVYNIILLIYGFLFGQFQFFWEFEKRFFGRMMPKKKKSKEYPQM